MKIKNNLAVSDTEFVFDPVSGDSFTTNPMGAEILTMLRNGDEPNIIKNKVTEKYDVEASTFENDYFDFVNMLKRFNLTENEY